MRKDGVTLLELLIVFAIIAILARVMMPTFKKSAYEAQEARTLHDFDAIKAAARSLYFDIEEWPPIGIAGDGLINTNGIAKANLWLGPYLREWKDDPWGTPYRLLKTGPTNSLWVSSNGPDKAINTTDDLVLLIFPKTE